MLKQVGKFYLPVDFIILERDKNAHVLLILKRPFLATIKTIINVKNKKMTFEIRDKKVKFNVFHLTKQRYCINSCCKVDIIRKCIEEKYLKELLESCLVHHGMVNNENVKIIAYA